MFVECGRNGLDADVPSLPDIDRCSPRPKFNAIITPSHHRPTTRNKTDTKHHN